MSVFPKYPDIGTWQWWAVSVLRTARMFLALMGFYYVTGAPLTKVQTVVPAIFASIAVHIYIAYREWHGSNGHPA